MRKVPGFTQQNYFDIFVSAMEGGSNYWAKVKEYHWQKKGAVPGATVAESSDLENFRAVIVNFEDDKQPEYIVNADTVKKGLELLYNGKVTSGGQAWNPGMQLRVVSNILEGNDDMYDADVVIQAGLFGDIIYG